LIIHVVKPGESIFSIARIYGVSPSKVISENELSNPNNLAVGQTLVISKENRQHMVAPGESLFYIAGIYGVKVKDILAANPNITNPSLIYPGLIINIPQNIEKLGTIKVNGYAFPNIDINILNKTLPNLTYLSIFSHEVRPDGSLSTVNDARLIRLAKESKVAPLMVITNIEEGGSFSSSLGHTILTNNGVQEKLISNVIDTLKAKGYYGLGIDFEYLYPTDKENYNNFLRKVTQRLGDLGYTVTTALAPKISSEQKGLLYEAHDYPVHGALADHVIIMTYEWGYTFGPPLAVAPINEVRKVLDYATSVIPSNKILMGMPNYGYDWTLPYVQGTAATTLSNTGAVNLAISVGGRIEFDDESKAPFFYYYDSSGRQHIVWFEDARSTMEKLKLVDEYKLGGVSYWTIGRHFPQNWLVLNSMYNVKKLL